MVGRIGEQVWRGAKASQPQAGHLAQASPRKIAQFRHAGQTRHRLTAMRERSAV
jgi:hypothetical protein